MPFDPEKICWLSGMPRSGTTWVSQILASSQDTKVKFCPLFSYEFKHALDPQSSPADWARLFEEAFETPSDYMDQDHLRKDGLVPRFDPHAAADTLVIKSNRFHHLVPDLLNKSVHAKLVYLVRHPAATLYSWLSNPTEFPEGANAQDQWRSGACRKTDVGEFWGFDDWKKVTLQALRLQKEFPERVRIQEYGIFSRNPLDEASDLFAFLGLPFTQEVIDFINLSRARHDPNKRSVYKHPGNDDAWKVGLDSWMIKAIEDEVRGTTLERFVDTE